MMWTEGDKEEPSGRDVGQEIETSWFSEPDDHATIDEQPQRDYCRVYDVCLLIICTVLSYWINYGGASTVIYRYFQREKKGWRVDRRTLTDGIVNVLGDRCGVRPVVGHRRSRPSGYHSSSTATADTSLCRPAAQRIRPWPDTEARHTARCENRVGENDEKRNARQTDRPGGPRRKETTAGNTTRGIEHNGRRPELSSPANRSDPNIALLSDWRGGALTVGGQRSGGEGKKTH